jgi:DNA polymerase-3 subunit epsilon
MLVLGLDLESTTFDLDILRITEFGTVLYDTDLKCPIEVQADIVYEPDIKLPMDPFVVGLTGITDQMVQNYGKSPKEVLERFFSLYERADYVVAHNGNEFDCPALGRFIKRYESELSHIPEPKHWIDTMIDLPYGEYVTTRKLEDLTGRHGFLNPFPHRAFTDVMSMLRIMSEYPMEQVLEISHSPTLVFKANVDYHDREVAKAAKFRWDSGTRRWLYKKKLALLDQEAYEAGTLWDFPYVEVKE